MVRKRKTKLPARGDAFAFPIGDGRFCVCRVLLDADSKQAKQWSGKAVLVACSSWIGNEVPSADSPKLRPILQLKHHSWNNSPNILWIPEEPPQDFIPIGTIEPTAKEQAIECMRFGNWNALTLQPLAQWKWDNERSVVLAEDSAREKDELETRLKEQQEREQYLANITLEQLREHRFFPNWKGLPSPKATRASRKVMAETVEELLGLGPRASKKERLTILRRCIGSFNQLDAEMHFIETVEREDICEEFEAVVCACGLRDTRDLADRWREW